MTLIKFSPNKLNYFIQILNKHINYYKLTEQFSTNFDKRKKKSMAYFWISFLNEYSVKSNWIACQTMLFVGNVWIKLYISNREQADEVSNIRNSKLIEGVRSKFHLIKYVDPQGTVSGPPLFLIYITNLLRIINQGELIMYNNEQSMFLAFEVKYSYHPSV